MDLLMNNAFSIQCLIDVITLFYHESEKILCEYWKEYTHIHFGVEIISKRNRQVNPIRILQIITGDEKAKLADYDEPIEKKELSILSTTTRIIHPLDITTENCSNYQDDIFLGYWNFLNSYEIVCGRLRRVITDEESSEEFN